MGVGDEGMGGSEKATMVKFGGKEDIGQAGDPGQWFLTWGDYAPPGEFGNILGGAIGI